MKHFNFLSKSSSRSCGHSSVTLASTVGSPSAHRRGAMLKLISVLVLIFTFGVGNVWGVDASFTNGTNGSSCTVNFGNNVSKTGVKVGTGSKGGDMSITIPANAANVSLYAGAWNNVTTLSLNITTTTPNVTISPNTLALDYNSGFTGTSFTFGTTNSSGNNAKESDYKFDITLSGTGVSNQKVLKFATSITKRFIAWGAKYVFTPTAPTNGTITSSSAHLSWTYANTTDKYEVYYSTNNTAPNANTTPSVSSSTIGTTKSVDLSGLSGGTTYYWWVRAVDDYCKSAWVAGSSFTTTAAAFTITAQSNNNTYGTVSGTSTITASPKSGYRVSTTNPYSVSPANSATVSQNGNTFTVTPSANTTVTINFEAIPTHKISFNTGGLTTIGDATGIQEGAIYNITQTPAASLTENCEYGTFVGWTTASSIANPSVKPALVSSVTMSTSDVTLYAVYSKTVGGGSAAAVGTTLWAETWASATTSTGNGTPSKDDAKASKNCSTGKGTTMYSGATISYSETDENVYCRAENTGGGTSPELLLSQNKEWTISGIPTGGATELTLTYSSNNTKSSVTCSTTDVTIDGSSKSYTIDNSVAKAETIELVFSASGNTRIDNVSLTVKTAGSSGTTTYSLNPNCCEPLAQINGSINLSHF